MKRQRDTIYWSYFARAEARQRAYGLRCRLGDLAKQAQIDVTRLSQIFNRKVKCPDRKENPQLERIAACLCLPAERGEFLEAARQSNEALDSHPGAPVFHIKILSYGGLRDESAHAVTLNGNSGLTGPRGFLLDCFSRMVNFIGQTDLTAPKAQITLSRVLGSAPLQPGDVMLSHLAAGNLINKCYYFCTPISIGVGGLLYVKNLPQKDRQSFVNAARSSILSSAVSGIDNIEFQCMRDEVGDRFLRMLPSSPTTKHSIRDLSASDCCNALISASRPGSTRIAALVADELTCYLALQSLSRDAALLFASDAKVPRFYFGFSVSRSDYELRKELNRGSELYLQSDMLYIIERYSQMYRELVDFAKSLKQFSGPTWLSTDPHLWAQRVCGLRPRAVPSTLISPAWRPILDQVRKNCVPKKQNGQ